ncbi:MAG: hypothetical protein KDK99_06455 [Verrucomicrobiales bacterium]|nr:hypothetical protein [Verrucomicrobiales bacterium]
MLLTISVLGILTGLALMMLGGQYDSYESIYSRRNAQELVSEFNAAQVAGVNFLVPGDKMATLNAIRVGAVAEGGAFNGRRFGVPSIKEEDVTKAAVHVTLTTAGGMRYDPVEY